MTLVSIPTTLQMPAQHPIWQQVNRAVLLSLIALLDPLTNVVCSLVYAPGSAASELRNPRTEFPNVHGFGALLPKNSAG